LITSHWISKHFVLLRPSTNRPFSRDRREATSKEKKKNIPFLFLLEATLLGKRSKGMPKKKNRGGGGGAAEGGGGDARADGTATAAAEIISVGSTIKASSSGFRYSTF
jgi:hypothetical protein